MPRGIDSKKGVQLVYRRFSAFHRFNHYLVMVSFFGLALTGMPLKFQDSFWSPLFINAVGGVEMAGLIHRVMAVSKATFQSVYLLGEIRLLGSLRRDNSYRRIRLDDVVSRGGHQHIARCDTECSTCDSLQ